MRRRYVDPSQLEFNFSFERQINCQQSVQSKQTSTYRDRVLVVIESASGWLTGQQIAQAVGLSYKQTIDALNALNNMERIARTGRKFTARWGRVELNQDNTSAESFHLLTDCFRAFFK